MDPQLRDDPMRRPHDFSKAYSLLVNREIARRLLHEPALVRELKRETARMTDPHQVHAKALWTRLAAEPVETIASELSRDDERGDVVRETRPPFVALDHPTRDRLLRGARKLLAGT